MSFKIVNVEGHKSKGITQATILNHLRKIIFSKYTVITSN